MLARLRAKQAKSPSEQLQSTAVVKSPSAQGASVFSPYRQSPPAHLQLRRVHRPEDRSSRRVPNRAFFATLSRKRFPLRMLEGEGTATSPYAVRAALAGAEGYAASAATLPYVCLGMP
jgi:hypothetical protein